MALVQSHLVFRDGKFIALGPNDIRDSEDHAEILATRVLVDGKPAFVLPWISGRAVSAKPRHLSVFRLNLFYVANRDRLEYPRELSGAHAIDRNVMRAYTDSLLEACLSPEIKGAALRSAHSNPRIIPERDDFEHLKSIDQGAYDSRIREYCSTMRLIEYAQARDIERKLERCVIKLGRLAVDESFKKVVLILDEDPNHPDNLIAFMAWERIRTMISSVVVFRSSVVEPRDAPSEKSTIYVSFSLYMDPGKQERMMHALSKIRYSTEKDLKLFAFSLFGPVWRAPKGVIASGYNRVQIFRETQSDRARVFTYSDDRDVDWIAAGVFSQLTGITDNTVWTYSDLAYRGLNGGMEFLSGKRGRFEERTKQGVAAMLKGQKPIPLYESQDDVPLIQNFKRDEERLDFASIWYVYPVFNLDKTGPHEMLEARSMSEVLHRAH